MNFFKKKFGNNSESKIKQNDSPEKKVRSALTFLLSPKSKKKVEKSPSNSEENDFVTPIKNITFESENRELEFPAPKPKKLARPRPRGSFVSILARNVNKRLENKDEGSLRQIYEKLPFFERNKIQDVVCLITKTLSQYFSSVVLGLEFIQKNSEKFENLEDKNDDEFQSKIRKTCLNFNKEIKNALKEFSEEVNNLVKQEEVMETQDENLSEKIQKIYEGNFEDKANIFNIEQLKSNKYIISELIDLIGDGTNGDKGIVIPTSTVPFRKIMDSIETDVDYLDNWISSRCRVIRRDINKCWTMLTGITGEEQRTNNPNVVVQFSDNNDNELFDIIKKLKAQFKYYNHYKVQKAILTLDSTCYRVDISKDGKKIYAGGNGCRLRRRNLNDVNKNIYSKKKYSVFGLLIDYRDDVWIHDGINNKIICLDNDLQEKVSFEGKCFNQCGFASTEVICWNRARDRIYWHKGKGFLGVINIRDMDEATYGDSISDSDFIRKIEVTKDESRLVILDSDFLTFHIYEVKRQRRINTWKYENPELNKPKIFSFALTENSNFIFIGGDHKYKGPIKKKRREAFISVHRVEEGFPLVETLKFDMIENHFITITRDEESGVILACDYGKDMLVLRFSEDSVSIVQHLDDVHQDYAFSVKCRNNRLYTCSLSNKVSVIEFSRFRKEA